MPHVPEKQPVVTEPDPGYQLCPSCGGERICWLCRGEGLIDGEHCKECLHRGYCIGCDGGGQIPDWVKI